MAGLKRWFPVLRIPIALIGISLFFTVYNRFLLDANLRNLRSSLSVLDAATGVGQAEAALLLVDQTLVAHMAEEETRLQALATFQYAQGTLAAEQRTRPVEDAQAMLAILGEEQAAARPGFLRTLDGLATGTRSALGQAALLPRQVFGGRGSPEINQEQLQEAARLERLGRFPEAIGIYEELLKRHPRYAGRALLKLRLGYVYQRTQAFDQAKRLYREAARETRSVQENQVALQLLEKLTQARAQKGRVKPLERRLSSMGPGPQRQRVAFELGRTLLQLYTLDKAAAAFQEAFLADPEGELAPSCLFKEAWCFRTAGRMEEALDLFLKIIHKYPQGTWAVASYLQIAELYKATGDYTSAAFVYEQALAETEDPVIRAVLHAQAGSTYYFDLTDPEKARNFFRDLEDKFPASPLAGFWNRIQDLRKKKGGLGFQSPPPKEGVPPAPLPKLEESPTMGLTVGSPIVNWLEGFLPIFVDIFSDRLAKYMQATGEKELTRRFTNFEFRDLVVRQVQRQFSNQVSDIRTSIHPDGFVGAGEVQLGRLRFVVQARIGVTIVNERPHTVIQEVKVGRIPVPKAILKILEARVNSRVDQAKYPLKVKQYKLHEGYAVISVELVGEITR